MKKLLLITGDLACGKTTFAKLLSKRYDTNLYFKDSLKELLGDAIGFTNREENLKLSKAAVQVMVHIFSEFAPLGKNLILEANFRTHELEKLHEIAARNGYDVLTLLFDGECKVLHDRVDLQKIAPMKISDFTPRGCTALMDALGGAIHHMGNVHKYARLKA